MTNPNVDEEKEDIPDWLQELEAAEAEEEESEASTSTESSWWLTDLAEDVAEESVTPQPQPAPTPPPVARAEESATLQTELTPAATTAAAVTSEEPVYCINHPRVETRLRCNRCNAPICPKCAVRTPVGFRCPQCVRGQQDVFYSATTGDNLMAVVVSLPLAVVAGFIMNYLGWFFAIFLGPLIGGLIAEAVYRANGRRRGRQIKWIVGICIVAGALIGPLFSMLFLYLFSYTSSPAGLLFQLAFRVNLVYVILAVFAASARLR